MIEKVNFVFDRVVDNGVVFYDLSSVFVGIVIKIDL